MAKVIYVGPHIDGVYVPYGVGGLEIPRGEPTEVPDDLAAGLLDQPSNWQPAPDEQPTQDPVKPGGDEGVTDES